MKVKKLRVVIIFLLFIAYFFIAARPVPRETILASGWISSLETEGIEGGAANLTGRLLPFTLGGRFGYIDSSNGQFAINRVKSNDISLGENIWTEYAAQPLNIEIKNISGETKFNIENPGGYPFFLDNRIFIFGSDDYELSEIDSSGNILWTYDFGAPLTCIDAAAGLVLTGSLDGAIEILDSKGSRVFYFKPGGSRIEAIYGCAISRNGSRIGIISGIDKQRFLLFERFAGTNDYRIIYHEFLESGFIRPVRISFIDEDRRIIFERAGGINCYNIKSRRGFLIPLYGEIVSMDSSGDNGLLFLITSPLLRTNDLPQVGLPQVKELIGVKLPQDKRFGSENTRHSIFLRAPFKSDDVFLGRADSKLVVGGGAALISFDLEGK